MSDLKASSDPRADNSLRHGHTRGHQYSPTYHSWQAMLARCRYLERDKENKHAGRGIKVCDRWQKSFENFLSDMGERPEGTTLERSNNNGNYDPGNCVWATATQQARNRRNARLTFDAAKQVASRMLRGERAKAVALDYGISESLPREILKGRTWRDALAAAKQEADSA